jgi:hypothetical protein
LGDSADFIFARGGYLAQALSGKPRWRIHLPISRACDHDEANAITRILSARIFSEPKESIDAIDVVSFRAAQVSYMPTRSKDQQYRCEVKDIGFVGCFEKRQIGGKQLGNPTKESNPTLSIPAERSPSGGLFVF